MSFDKLRTNRAFAGILRLEFEKAALLRDRIIDLRKVLAG